MLSIELEQKVDAYKVHKDLSSQEGNRVRHSEASESWKVRP